MKQLIIALCALGLAATTQADTPIVSPPPDALAATAPAKTPEPVSTTTPDNTRYVNDPNLLAGCQARLSAFNDKPCDIVFIGDSITSGWFGAGKAIWEKNYEPRRALNFGINGDKIQNVLWRLNNMEIQNLKPKVAVILIGTNNTANSVHEIADGVKAVIANTQAAFSGVKIILVSILPNERAFDKMKQANSIIKSYADDGTIYYLDLASLMSSTIKTTSEGQADSSWKGLSKDRLNLDASGYQIWADAMEPLLTKLLAGGQ